MLIAIVFRFNELFRCLCLMLPSNVFMPQEKSFTCFWSSFQNAAETHCSVGRTWPSLMNVRMEQTKEKLLMNRSVRIESIFINLVLLTLRVSESKNNQFQSLVTDNISNNISNFRSKPSGSQVPVFKPKVDPSPLCTNRYNGCPRLQSTPLIKK